MASNLENSFLSYLKNNLTDDPKANPLVKIQITLNKNYPCAIRKNEISNPACVIDKDSLYNPQDIYSMLSARAEQEATIKAIYDNEKKEFVASFEKIKLSITQIIDATTQKILLQYPVPIVYQFLKDFSASLIKTPDEFTRRFKDACNSLASNLSNDTVSIDYLKKKTNEVINQFQKIFQDQISIFLKNDFRIPSKIKKLNSDEKPFQDYLCYGGRGMVNHPTLPQYSLLTWGGVLQLRNEANSSLIFKKRVEVGGNFGAHSQSWNPSGKRLAIGGCANKTINILKENGETEKVIKCIVPALQLWRICWVGDNKIVAGFNTKNLILYDADTTYTIREASLNEGGASESMTVLNRKKIKLLIGSIDGNLFCFKDNLVELWRKEKYHNDRIKMISVDKQNIKVATCSNDMSVVVYDTKKKKIIMQKFFENKVFEVHWSQEDNYLAIKLEFTKKIAIILPDSGQTLAWLADEVNVFSGLLPIKSRIDEFVLTTGLTDKPLTNILRIKIC